MVLVQRKVKAIYIGETHVRPNIKPRLCFIANSSSTIAIGKNGTPTSLTLETSADNKNWSDYTFGTNITLSVGQKLYMRNKSETTTGFSIGSGGYYKFNISGSVAVEGDITYLLNKNGTDTILSDYCFLYLFQNCPITTAPGLPAINLKPYCYNQTFLGTNITNLPLLPAKTLPDCCYLNMFNNNTNIKLSTTQTGEYQTPYRIPTEGTGTIGVNSLANMFNGTGGTWTGTPTINTTYYTSNAVI